MDEVSRLRDLARLARIVDGTYGKFDPSLLEQSFIQMSAYAPATLHVPSPQLYNLNDQQKDAVESYLKSVGETARPSALDYTGSYAHQTAQRMIFASETQRTSGNLSESRAYLIPLARKIYENGHRLLNDFTKNNAIGGCVQQMRGTLSLDEAHLFPEDFMSGPYRLEVTLDTHLRSVASLAALRTQMKELASNPETFLSQGYKTITDSAIRLRRQLGTLGRFQDTPQTFEVFVDSCIDKDNYWFHKDNNNTVVCFGNLLAHNPTLHVINGGETIDALAQLVELDYYLVSPSVLLQRHAALVAVQNDTTRKMKVRVQEVFPAYSQLISDMTDAIQYCQEVVNPALRKTYFLQHKNLLEYAVYPSKEDPVLTKLLPKLSSNGTIRHYHDTQKFIDAFESATEEQRIKMLQRIRANLCFRNQQNPDVNTYLFNRHADALGAADIQVD